MIKIVDKGVLNTIQVNRAGHKSEESSIQILGNNNSVIIESRCSFKGLRIVIRGDNNKVVIKRGSWFLGGSISVSNFSTLEIGERCSFGGRLEFVIDLAKVEFGNDCMVAAGLTVRSTDTHGIYSLDSGELINKPKDISIGDYVWFGKNATVLKGAKIAPCNIVGMDSIFSSESQPFELWAGRTAKKIKENVMWSKSARLSNIEDDKYAKMYIDKYKNKDIENQSSETPTIDENVDNLALDE